MKKLQAQNQQNQTTLNQQKGGVEMRKPTQQITQQTQQEPTIYFVTFSHKLPKEQSKQVITELRKRFIGQPVFIRKPPAGRKQVIEIDGVWVIVTIPYASRQEQTSTKQEAPQDQNSGFRLEELITKTEKSKKG